MPPTVTFSSEASITIFALARICHRTLCLLLRQFYWHSFFYYHVNICTWKAPMQANYFVLVFSGEGPLECTSCPAHFMLDGGLCMECLGSQYYDPPTQLCKACHESCHMCSGPGPTSCVACLFPLHLDKQNNQCVPCCTQPDQQNCCHCDSETGKTAYTVLIHDALSFSVLFEFWNI